MSPAPLPPKPARAQAAKPAARRVARTDGEATRAKLLEAAGRQFADHGYAEATSKAIAQAAGVDLASINYHFGSRAGLYQAVLVLAHNHLLDVEQLRRLAGGTASASDKLRGLITLLVRNARAGGAAWHLRVLARELFAPSSHFGVLLESAVPPKLMAVKQILAEVTGLSVDDPALARCLLSVGAPCLMLVLAQGRLPGPIQQVLEATDAQIIDHLHRFAIAGLHEIVGTPAAKPAVAPRRAKSRR